MSVGHAGIPEEQHFILSTLAPSAGQKRLALVVVGAIVFVYVLITVGPLKGLHVARVDAFVPAYVTTMFVCDSITALLLYAQFAIVRSRSSLVVASAYLFVALAMIPFILAFPGVFVSGAGLLGGMQSTSWIYFFQHAGFPLFIMGYALIKDSDLNRRQWKASASAEIGLSIGLTAALVLAGAFLFIGGETWLPRVTLDSMHFGGLWWYPASAVALLNIAAIVVLWNRRRVALDLWLMVVMFLYAIEIPLSYYPDPQRFSVGWYAVRGFGVLSSSIVLMLLIHEIATLYARLLGAVLAHRHEREARLMTGDAVAASIAHELRQPLTAMVTTADAGLRFLDRLMPNLDKAKEAFRNIASDGHRAGAVIASIRADFKTDVQEKTAFDLDDLVQEALAFGRPELEKHGIAVQLATHARSVQVTGNRVQLLQVMLNLIMNAVDAMAGSGGPRILGVRSDAHDGNQVTVQFADTGSGIGAGDAERVFNPLFTTKPDGMGMGLSICRAIIEAHEGRLWFVPNTPRGTVFQFTLQTHATASARAA